ncbi:MAG: hypothetical protein JO082_04605 [Mycobacterium sp.]|nr:hypothetical protein [Mycobacterium sp.]MBV9721180.1 hypothetical protein [Mycobacterium sp.]
MTTPEEYETLQQWAFHIEPWFTHDGESWTGTYPNADWSVSAPTEEEAHDKLGAEFIQHQNAGEDDLAYANAVMLRHLRKPVPGMYAMANELYLELKDEPRADMDRAFKEAEAKRLRGETYTKDDYLRSREG